MKTLGRWSESNRPRVLIASADCFTRLQVPDKELDVHPSCPTRQFRSISQHAHSEEFSGARMDDDSNRREGANVHVRDYTQHSEIVRDPAIACRGPGHIDAIICGQRDGWELSDSRGRVLRRFLRQTLEAAEVDW